MLLRSGTPVLLVVNKVDSLGAPPLELYDFYSLGLGKGGRAVASGVSTTKTRFLLCNFHSFCDVDSVA